METVKVLNIDIQNITRQELLENLKEGVLVTPNLDHLIKLQKDKDFYDCYKKAGWVVCDSNILRLFSKLLKKLNRASCGPRGHMKPGVVLSAFNIMGILPCFDRLYS